MKLNEDEKKFDSSLVSGKQHEGFVFKYWNLKHYNPKVKLFKGFQVCL